MATTNNQTTMPLVDRWKRTGMLGTASSPTANQTAAGAVTSNPNTAPATTTSAPRTTNTGTTPGVGGVTTVAAPTPVATELWNVDANQLTSENLNKLLSEGSSYLDLARTGAAQTANSRGLLNSSMAAGAGEAAAIGAALPIAQSDASVYADSAKTNATAKNNMNQFNANLSYDAGKTNAGFYNDRSLQDSRIAAEMKMQDKSLASAEKISAANNSAALERTKYTTDANTAMAAADRASREAMNKYNTDASTANAAAELSARMQMNSDNNAAAFDRTMASIDASYKASYLSTITTYNAGYSNYVNQVNAMDIPTDAKTSLISAAATVYNDNVAITNSMYSDLPALFGVTTAQ